MPQVLHANMQVSVLGKTHTGRLKKAAYNISIISYHETISTSSESTADIVGNFDLNM